METAERCGFKVTLRPRESMGLRGGTATLWTPLRERAEELVAEAPDLRSFEAIPWAELPEDVRARFERGSVQPAAA